ncbi:MAG: DUF721 domain-containing protein [Myxococcota bacterium]|nr:DUF721 domain-containing protein [Myxococcota bacterium]
MRDRDRGGPPVRAGDEAARLLDGLFRSREARIGRLLCDAWTRAVGDRAAAVVRPVRLSGGVLLVRAASPVWRAEIRLRAAEIVERLRAEIGDAVRSLDIRVGTAGDMRQAPAGPGVSVERSPMPELGDLAGTLQSDDLRELAAALATGATPSGRPIADRPARPGRRVPRRAR